MFSIPICRYSNDSDYETGGKSKIYYNKGSKGKPGGKAFDKKNVPELPGSLIHFKPARGLMWIILK